MMDEDVQATSLGIIAGIRGNYTKRAHIKYLFQNQAEVEGIYKHVDIAGTAKDQNPCDNSIRRKSRRKDST